MHPTNDAKLCLMKIRPIRMILILLFVVLLVATIVLLSVLLTTGKSTSTFEHLYFDSENAMNLTSSPFNCASSMSLKRFFEPTSKMSWIVYDKHYKDWKRVKRRFVPSSSRLNTKTVIISPLYAVNSICALRISLALQSNVSFQAYVVPASEKQPIPVNLTTGLCHFATVENQSLFSRLKPSFRLALVTGSELNHTEHLFGSVSAHTCTRFQALTSNPQPVSNPQFELLQPGEENACSFEYNHGLVDCNWMQVIRDDDVEFERLMTHDCIETGALSGRGNSDIWFLFLTSTLPQSRSFLVSPVIEGGLNSITVFLMYVTQCSNTTLRYYTITSLYEIDEIEEGVRKPDQVVELPQSAFSWLDLSVSLSIPRTYESFQVVIEANINPRSNCSAHFCLDGNERKTFGTPFLGIDQIDVKTTFDSCPKPTGNSSFVNNCAFQNRIGSETRCLWQSSAPSSLPPYLPESIMSQFLHWKLINKSSETTNEHEALDRHFTGRGYIVEYGNYAPDNFFRTPYLVNDRNCSCPMSFWFLLRGFFAPRLQVNVVINVESPNGRLKLPQWSAFGEINNGNWTQANISISLPSKKPFYVEFTVTDIPDARARAYIDDVSFHECDFRLTTE